MDAGKNVSVVTPLLAPAGDFKARLMMTPLFFLFSPPVVSLHFSTHFNGALK